MAEVMKFEDFKNEGTESAVKVSSRINSIFFYNELTRTKVIITTNVIHRLRENTDSRVATTLWKTEI